ncbi:benzoate para-hydroxylase [Mycena filopes]|nr:benzoate para-hydroxylase [Mycena filopes]
MLVSLASSTFTLYSAVAGAVSLILVLRLASRPLSRIPGPFVTRWTNLWLAYHAHQGRRYKAVDEAHQRYGVVVRIGPNHFSVASPEALSIIYGQGPNAPPKSVFYDVFVTNTNTSIFSTRDRKSHSTKRRAISHAFSSSALQEFIPFIEATLDQFTQRMDQFCDTNEFFDALLWFNYLAFDILSDLAFGERIGMLKQGSDVVAIRRQDDSWVSENAITLVDEREHFAAVAGIHPLLKWIARLVPSLSGNHATSGLEELARHQVLKRLACHTSRNDILGKLIKARGYDARSPTADEIADLTAESVTLLIAGSDTTSNSIAVILHFIIGYPRVYEKLLGLLLDATSDQQGVTYEQIKDIPYLQATINEGLRLHSTTAIGLPRVAPPGGLFCEGHYFPAGTELSVPGWTIGHDPEIWGDAMHFRPERWLEQKDLRRYLLAFGKGPRACVGQNMAYIEMSSVIATMLLRYKLEARSKDLKTTEGFIHKPVDFYMKLSRR